MISIIPDRPAFMTNPATAISPPAAIGDHKPANQAVLDWVHEVELLTQPKNIFWCDGSERENDFLISESLKHEILINLDQKKAPRSYLHRSNPNDVARVEQFTFICTPTKAEAGPTNNWSEPAETYSKLHGLLKGAMRGRTMFVVPYIGAAGFAANEDWIRGHGFQICRAQHANNDSNGGDRGQTAWQRSEGGMDPRRAFAARCQSGAALHLSFSAG